MNRKFKEFIFIVIASFCAIFIYGKTSIEIHRFLIINKFDLDMIQKILMTYYSLLTTFFTMIALSLMNVFKIFAHPKIRIEFLDRKEHIIESLVFENMDHTEDLTIKVSTTLNYFQNFVLKKFKADLYISISPKIGQIIPKKGFDENISSSLKCDVLRYFSHSKNEHSINKGVTLKMNMSGNCGLEVGLKTNNRKIDFFLNRYCKFDNSKIELRGNWSELSK